MFQEFESANEDRLMALKNIQENKAKVSMLCNKKIRLKHFAEGDLVWKLYYVLELELLNLASGHLIGKAFLLLLKLFVTPS